MADAHIATNPAHVTHRCVDAFDVELILQTDGKSVEQADSSAVSLLVLVQLLGTSQSLVNKKLMKTIILGT